MKGLFRLAGWILAVLLAAAALLYTAGRTREGRRRVEEWVNARGAEREGIGWRIEGLGGNWPWEVTARRVILTDDEGTWGSVEGVVALPARPSWVRRSLSVRQLRAERFQLVRRPVTDIRDRERKGEAERGQARWGLRVGRFICAELTVEDGLARHRLTASAVRGRMRWPSEGPLELHVRVPEGRWASHDWKGEGALRFEPGGMASLRATMQSAEDEVTIGWTRPAVSPHGRATIEGRLRCIGRYADVLPAPGLQGGGMGRLEWDATARGGRLQAHWSGPSLQRGPAILGGVRLRIEADWPWQEGGLRIQGRANTFRHGAWSGSAVRISGDLHQREGPVSLSLVSDAPHPASLRMGGQLQWRDMSLRIRHLEMKLKSDALLLQTHGSNQLTWRDGIWEADALTFEMNGGKIGAAVHWAAQGDSSLCMDFENLPLEWLDFLGAQGWGGRADGSLRLAGAWKRPAGYLDVALGDLKYPATAYDAWLPTRLRARADLDDERLTLAARTDPSEILPLNMEASFPLRRETDAFPLPDGSADWSAVLQGKWDTSAWQPVDTQGRFEWKGRLEGRLRVEGPWDQPVVGGSLSVSEGGVRDVFSGLAWSPVDIRIKGDDNVFKIEQGRVSGPGRGFMDLEGRAQWVPGGLPEGVLKLVFERFTLLREAFGSVAASGSISLEGAGKDWSLAGELGVEPAEWSIPRVIPPTIEDVEVIDVHAPPHVAPPPPPRDAAPWIAGWNVPLDIDLRTLGDIQLTGRGLHAAWRGRLNLGQTMADPLLTGRIRLRRGTLFLLGRRFDLLQADILLSEERPHDPQLIVRARTIAAGLTVELDITGPASRPDVALRSMPDLPQNEVLSHLLFGKSSDQISPLQALTLAYNINLLAGGENVLRLVEHGQSTLGIDQMELVLDEEQPGTAAVAVGMYLGSRFYVEGQKSLAGMEDEVAAEYFLTPSISIRTSARPGMREGIGIRWQREY